MSVLAENFRSYACKTLSIVFGIVGIVLTLEAGKTCEFISFEDTDANELDMVRDGEKPAFVFGGVFAADVGIWKYEITSGDNQQGCTDYPQKFFQIDGYPSLSTAQLCSLLAPIFCGMAIVAGLIDMCICIFRRSRLTSGLLFLFAFVLQGGTFAIVADPVFCFEDEELECTVGSGLYLSVAATCMYFLATCLSCCAPPSEPCRDNFKKGDHNNASTLTGN